MKVNEATGEVTVELAGKTFRLHATMKRFADYQAALDVVGMGGMWSMLSQRDPRAIYEGMRCLCSSGNAAELDDMLLIPNLAAMADAIQAALLAGMPNDKGKSRGNG